MGGLIGALIQKLVESFFGAGLDAAGERAGHGVRRVLIVLAALLAAWIAVASALLWDFERHPGVVGLARYVISGGPAWYLALPVVAVLTIIWLMLPIKGRHSITFFLAAATMALAIGEMAAYQGGGASDIGWAGVVSFVAALLLALLGVLLVYGDPPALDLPLARLSFDYWGRLRHLRALRQFARERGWQFSGPAGRRTIFTAEGAYDHDHLVTITSSAKFSASGGSAPTYTLSVKMGSPRDILAFNISHIRPPKNPKQPIVAGEVRIKGKRPLYFYVIPEPGQPIPADFLPRLRTLVEAGREHFHPRDFAHATPFGLRFTHLAGYSLTARDAHMGPLVVWMRELVGLLAMVSPAHAETPGETQAGPWRA